MRPACIPGPLRQVGGMMRAPPARRKSSCMSANRKLTFTRANVWLAKPLSPQASPAFRPPQGTIRLSRRTLVMSRPSLAITWTITETWLNRTSIHERIPARKSAIAFFALCAVIVGLLQWSAMSGQLGEMKSSGKDTRDLAEAAKTSADAAKSAAKTAADTLESAANCARMIQRHEPKHYR